MSILRILELKARHLFYGRPARNQLTVFDDDVFIVSYPKSGNTWARFLLAKSILGANVSWSTVDKVVPDIYRMSDRQLRKIRRPRIIKSHHPFDSRYKKVIYIVRNPEDVLSSYFYFHLKYKSNKYSDNRDSFLEFTYDFVRGNLDDFGTWNENVSSWIQCAADDCDSILVCRYEDMLTHPAQELGKMLAFLDVQVDPKILDDALIWGSKSNMATLESNELESPLFKNSNSSYKFVSSDYDKQSRIALSDVQKTLLRDSFGDMMESLGY